MDILRSEYHANQSLHRDSSKASHRAWMEPSVSTQLRARTHRPKSLLGRFLAYLWSLA